MTPHTCDHPGCAADPTHDRVTRLADDWLVAEHFCAAHAPADAEPVEAPRDPAGAG